MIISSALCGCKMSEYVLTIHNTYNTYIIALCVVKLVLHVYSMTDSVKQSLSCEANSSSAGGEILCILCFPKVDYWFSEAHHLPLSLSGLIHSTPTYHVCLRSSLTLRLLMSYIYGAPILDVSRSHTTTHYSR